MIKLPIEKYILREFQRSALKKIREQNIDRDWTNVVLTDEFTFGVEKRYWLLPNIPNCTTIRKLNKWKHGAISRDGKVNLHLFVNNLTKVDYVKILRDSFKDIKNKKKMFCASMKQWSNT